MLQHIKEHRLLQAGLAHILGTGREALVTSFPNGDNPIRMSAGQGMFSLSLLVSKSPLIALLWALSLCPSVWPGPAGLCSLSRAAMSMMPRRMLHWVALVMKPRCPGLGQEQ